MKFKTIFLIGVIGTTLMADPSYDAFKEQMESIKQQQQKEFLNYKKKQMESFEAYKKAQMKAFQEYKKEIGVYW